MILDAVEGGADGLRQLALLAFRNQLFAAHALIAPLSGMSLRLLETEWAKKFTEITRDNEDVNGVYLAITEYFQDTAKLWIEVVSKKKLLDKQAKTLDAMAKLGGRASGPAAGGGSSRGAEQGAG